MGLEPRKKGSAPKKPPEYNRQLNEMLSRFRLAFESFHRTNDQKTKNYYFDLMNRELGKIDDMAKSIAKKGVRKTEDLLSKDAKKYFMNPCDENYRALQQDIATLLESNN